MKTGFWAQGGGGEERVQLSDVIMTDEIDWTLTHRNLVSFSVEHFRNMLVSSYNEDAPSGEW